MWNYKDQSQIRMMRVLVMYDLPIQNKKEQHDYAVFHRFLINNSFYMMQESVYCRLARNNDFARKVIQQVADNAPKRGDVRCLKITEEQYQNIRIFCGQKSEQELLTTMEELVEI